MTLFRRLWRSTRAAAAAEMALVAPLLLIIMFGAVELGNYFYNEHILVKAVRDGARFAARQNFSYYSGCSGSPGGTVVADTRNLVKTGLLSGGSDRLAAWNATTISLTTNCTTTANSITLSGIYRGRASGAPRVTVTASVPYVPVLASIGFSGVGLSLNASEQAAVMGI